MKRHIHWLLWVSLILPAACSRPAMKSHPLWDQPAADAERLREDRVNVWPLFYYQDPSASVLWPFISATDTGHAVVPFYEYYGPDGQLRLIAIHQDVPAFADFQGRENYARVFNFIYDGKKQWIIFLPIYFHKLDKKRLFVIPFLFKNDEGFWTLPYTHFPNTQGVAGPLFCRHTSDDSCNTYYWFPFPIFGTWSGKGEGGGKGEGKGESEGSGKSGGGFIVFPLTYYNSKPDERTLNVLGPVFHYSQDHNDKMIYYAWPLGAAGVDEGISKNYFIPFWFSRAGESSHLFLSAPYIDIKDGPVRSRYVLGPVYISDENAKGYYRSVMFPLFHSFDNASRKGHSLLPFYWYSSDPQGIAHFYSPLYSYFSDGTMHNFLGPLYHHSAYQGQTDQWFAWPLFHAWSSKNEGGGWVFPLGYYNRQADGSRQVVTPAASYTDSSERQVANVLGPLYLKWKSKIGDWTYRTVLFPVWHEMDNRKEKSATKWLFPLFVYQKSPGKGKVLSLPISYGEDSSGYFLNILLFLFHRDKDGMSTYNWVLFPFMGWSKVHYNDKRSCYVFPLFNAERQNTSFSFGSIIGILLDFEASLKSKAEDRKDLWESAAWRAKNNAQCRPRDRPSESLSRDGESSRYSALLGLIRFRTQEHLQFRECVSTETLHPGEFRVDTLDFPSTLSIALKTMPKDITSTAVLAASFNTVRENRIFPLFYSEDRDGKESGFNILWRLFDTHTTLNEDGSRFTRSRVLWKFFHYEEEHDRMALDVFPFIAYDKKPDSDRFLLMGGLLGYSRKSDAPRLHFLYIPIPI